MRVVVLIIAISLLAVGCGNDGIDANHGTGPSDGAIALNSIVGTYSGYLSGRQPGDHGEYSQKISFKFEDTSFAWSNAESDESGHEWGAGDFQAAGDSISIADKEYRLANRTYLLIAGTYHITATSDAITLTQQRNDSNYQVVTLTRSE